MRMAPSDITNPIVTLKKRDDFLCLRKGKKWVSKTVIIQALPNELNTVRAGYTITKKVFKSAVKRNRVKRRLRAAANDVLGMHAPTGYDFNLIGREDTLSVPYDILVKDLKWCLKRLDLAKP